MSKKYLIAIDDGHGMKTAGKRTPPIPELNGRVVRENEFNREVKRFLVDELGRCGFDTLIVAPGDEDIALETRVNVANAANAHAYIAIHYNAFDGKFTGNDPEGHSVHIYPGSKEGRRLAEYIMKYLPKGTSQKNRGIRENNFYVLRKTNMPAILSENGFMDNKREAILMLNVDFQKEVAREHAQGICEYFGVKYIPEVKPSEPKVEPEKGIYYRVQTGAFERKINAQNWEKELIAMGEDTYVVFADGYYKVQVGAFTKKSNADKKEKELKSKNIPTYVTTRAGEPVSFNTSNQVDLNKVAIEVINGEWGTGKDREKKLEEAGFNYKQIQGLVNEIIYKGKTKINFKVGNKVKVKKGAKTFDNKNLAPFVFNDVYDIIQINGNRIVIGKGKKITAAINKNDLILQ